MARADRAELQDIVANEEHVLGIRVGTARREGKALNLKTVLVFHLRDGKVVEAWEHLEDSQTWDDFFA